MIEIVPFSVELLQSAYRVQLNSDESWSMEQLAAELKNSRAMGFCALIDGEVTAYASLHIIDDECTLNNIVVAPHHRGKGIATHLLTCMVNFFVDHIGQCKIFLEVRTENKAAISLYEKFGFYKVGLRKGFYTEPDDDAILFLKEIQ